MKKLLILAAGLALAGAAAAATPPRQQSEGASWYWWLHPKLGMVKVDRATNAIIVVRKQQRATQAAAR